VPVACHSRCSSLSGPPVSAFAMGLTVYDNGTDQPIGGGNLVSH
jgi:hypothetical protein